MHASPCGHLWKALLAKVDFSIPAAFKCVEDGRRKTKTSTPRSHRFYPFLSEPTGLVWERKTSRVSPGISIMATFFGESLHPDGDVLIIVGTSSLSLERDYERSSKCWARILYLVCSLNTVYKQCQSTLYIYSTYAFCTYCMYEADLKKDTWKRGSELTHLDPSTAHFHGGGFQSSTCLSQNKVFERDESDTTTPRTFHLAPTRPFVPLKSEEHGQHGAAIDERRKPRPDLHVSLSISIPFKCSPTTNHSTLIPFPFPFELLWLSLSPTLHL
jgi:hypothetical protein